jgi:hypothetical protein
MRLAFWTGCDLTIRDAATRSARQSNEAPNGIFQQAHTTLQGRCIRSAGAFSLIPNRGDGQVDLT